MRDYEQISKWKRASAWQEAEVVNALSNRKALSPRTALLLSLALLLGCTEWAFSDEITFSNGEHITGKLIGVHAGAVSFQSDRLGLMQIPAGTDMSLVVSGNVVIRTTDGKEYSGAMRAGSGKTWTLSTVDNTQRMDIVPTEVVSITPAPDSESSSDDAAVVATTTRENIWEGAKDRPRLIGPWSVDSRIALSGVDSTKSRRLLHWNGELDNATHVGVLKFTAERIYSVSTGPTGKEFLDDDLTRGDVNFTKDVSERISTYGDFEGLHDVVRYLDKRLTVAGGGQYKVLAYPKARIVAFVGPAFIHYSYLANQNVTTPPVDFAAIQFGYLSRFNLPWSFRLQHAFRFDQGYNSDGSYLSHVDARVQRDITRWLSVDGRVADDFDSKAAYQAKQNTFRYSAGLGVSFDAF